MIEKLSAVLGMDGGHAVHWCPACRCHHRIRVDDTGSIGPRWKLQGTHDRPTLDPSVRISSSRPDKTGGMETFTICHYVLTDGVINFCDDFSHELAGKKVPLPPLPA